MTIIYFLLMLSVIICIHEAGHLVAAKLFGVYCFEYAIGMGPVVLRKKFKETQFSIRAIPMGGFVAMAGDEEGDQLYPDANVPDERRLTNIPAWKQIIIMLAGVFMNFVLCIFILAMIVLYNGMYAVSGIPTIVDVVKDSPAERAGFKVDDQIIRIARENGSALQVSDYEEMSIYLSTVGDEELTVVVQRDNEPVTLTVRPELNEETGTYLMGIQMNAYTYVETNFLNCWYYACDETLMIAKLTLLSLKDLCFGRNLDQISGPVGIYTATEQSVSYGILGYLILIAQLSLNVGIMNLLPLPVLDGGRVVIAIGEGITKHKLSDRIKAGLMGACWILLILITILVTWKDILNLIK